MLSLGKITLNGEGYYLAAVAEGVDEYYRGVGEAPGRWSGTAAESLGLEGEVIPEQLRAVWSGLDPGTGEKLARFAGRTVAGFDLCFRAPKSVSVLAGLGDPYTAAVVRDAHDTAVLAAFAYVDANAGRSRTGKNGVNQVGVKGLIAAGFRHRTSRAGDPHLHTHMLVANMAECDDGRWRTLDGRVLFQYARTAGFLYEAQLRRELTVRLGVEWEPIENGIADLVGIDEDVRDQFSDRRREITEHLDQVGFRSARAAQIAALETRRAKDPSVDATAMSEVWAAKAAVIGFDPATLAAVVGRVPAQAPMIDAQAILADLVSEAGLTRQASTFTRRDTLRAIADRVPAGATVAQIEDLADLVFARLEVVRLVETEAPGLLASTSIRRTDGTIVAGGVDEPRWSTVELVALEQHLVTRAVARRDQACATVADEVLDEVLAARPTLAAEQVAMIVALTQRGHGLEVVAAAAGTGKTFTLDAARAAWEAAGYRVIGSALAGIAAQELQASAGIPASTLAQLTIALRAGEVRLDERTVLVIDEAAMAGTRLLAPVLDGADRAGAKIVLVGDPKQLSEIDAGGLLRGLGSRFETIELVENRRQRAQWERDALRELRAGDVDAAFAAFAGHDRVVTAPTAPQVRQAMVADWWSHRLADDTVAMMAVRRSEVDDLNGRARAYLVRAGQVTGPELVLDQRPYQVGDAVICLKNNRRLGVCNGTRATITHVDAAAGTLTIDAADRSVVLPADYLQAGHIAHGYATTIHKAQGATFDRGLLLGTDELYRERGYVGMSRGRESNHLYIVGAVPADDATGHGPPSRTPDPIEAVQHALTIETDKRLAIDTGDPVAVRPIEDLVAEKHRLHRLLATCPPDRSHDIRSLTARRDELAAQIEPLADRYNALADRRLRGPATRAEQRTLGRHLGERTSALSRVTTELWDATAAMTRRDTFLADHEADRQRLDHIAAALDHQIAGRVEQRLAEPTNYHLRILGPVPRDPTARAAWERGAHLLESHHLGADHDPTHPPRPSVLGSPTEAIEMRARLELVAQPGIHRAPVSRQVDVDIGLGL